MAIDKRMIAEVILVYLHINATVTFQAPGGIRKTKKHDGNVKFTCGHENEMKNIVLKSQIR